MDNFPPEEIAYQTAHIEDNRSVLITVVASVFTGVALLSLFIRIISRTVTRAKLGADDYLSIGATVALIGVFVTVCYAAHFGIGRHLIFVAQNPQNFIEIGKATLAMSVCYPFSMALGKLSLLTLFARIFTLSSRTVRIGVYFFSVYTILWLIALILLVFIQCRPLSSNWGVPYQCRVHFSASISTGVLNAISDLGILLLPQPSIWKLHLSLSKKAGLSFVFLIGGVATVVSIVRIPLLKGANSGADLDLTYTGAHAFLFTVIEPACVIISGCLPMIQGLYMRWIKPSPKSTKAGSYGRLVDSHGNYIRGTGGSEGTELSKYKGGSKASQTDDTDEIALNRSFGP